MTDHTLDAAKAVGATGSTIIAIEIAHKQMPTTQGVLAKCDK
jgi:DNA-binding XRE family transcriptional regulator